MCRPGEVLAECAVGIELDVAEILAGSRCSGRVRVDQGDGPDRFRECVQRLRADGFTTITSRSLACQCLGRGARTRAMQYQTESTTPAAAATTSPSTNEIAGPHKNRCPR